MSIVQFVYNYHCECLDSLVFPRFLPYFPRYAISLLYLQLYTVSLVQTLNPCETAVTVNADSDNKAPLSHAMRVLEQTNPSVLKLAGRSEPLMR